MDSVIKERTYYLYFHSNPSTNEVFYVGIGRSNSSRYISKRQRTILWQNYVGKYGFISTKVGICLTREQAIEMEKYWIKQFGRKDKGKGSLLNLTDGGEGAFGAVRSEEVKQRMSLAAKNRKRVIFTEEHRRNISKSHLGIKHSEKHKRNNSIAKILQHQTNPNMGMNGKKCSEETKRKIGEANKISVKKYWQNRKENAA